MSSRKRERKNKNTRNMVKVLAAMFAVLCPPVGIVLAFRSGWNGRMKFALTAVALGCMVLYAALLPSADYTVNGGIKLVALNEGVQIYGPELPEAMVKDYRVYGAPEVTSVLAVDDSEAEAVTYYYAASDGDCYHEYKCKFAFASSQKLTLREAYMLEYEPCGLCQPPVYTPGT